MNPISPTRRAALGLAWLALAGASAGALGVARASSSRDDDPGAQEDATPPPDVSTTGDLAGETTAVDPAGVEVMDPAALVGIQETLDRQGAARSARDRAAFMATIDQRNLTWRRIAGEYFDTYASTWSRHEQLTVTRVVPKQDGYVKAFNDHAPLLQAVWVFHPSDQGWLQAEPLNDELGQRQTRETDHFRLSYYSWDDDVVDGVAEVAEQAYAVVIQALGVEPGFSIVTSLNPTYASHSGLRGLAVQAAYLPDTKNMVLLRSPESFGAGEFTPDQTPAQTLAYPFTHELTHLVNDQIYRLVKMPCWMKEGLAEHVSGHYREDEVRAAYVARTQLSLDKADEVIEWNTDPSKGFTLTQISLAYGEAALAVAYFFEQFGQDRFWQLAQTYGDSRNWSESFLAVCGVTWERFRAGWDAWVRARLGL